MVARLEDVGTAWDEAISVIDEARRKQAAAPGLAEPAKKRSPPWTANGSASPPTAIYPMISLDDNAAERVIRRPVVTRKNACGSRNEDAAGLAARIWTVTAAEMVGMNVLTYSPPTSTPADTTAGNPCHAPNWNDSSPGPPPPQTSATGHGPQHPDNHTGTAPATASPRTRPLRPSACPISAGGVHRLEAETIQDQQVSPQELAELLVVAVVEAGGLDPLEELVGAFEPDGVPGARGGPRRSLSGAAARNVLPVPTCP